MHPSKSIDTFTMIYKRSSYVGTFCDDVKGLGARRPPATSASEAVNTINSLLYQLVAIAAKSTRVAKLIIHYTFINCANVNWP